MFLQEQTWHYAPSSQFPSLGSASGVIFGFHTTFSCISYLCIPCACLVIRFVLQKITQISCCCADLNPRWCVTNHLKTHHFLCVWLKAWTCKMTAPHICWQVYMHYNPRIGVIRLPEYRQDKCVPSIRVWARDWRHKVVMMVSVPEDRTACRAVADTAFPQ